MSKRPRAKIAERELMDLVFRADLPWVIEEFERPDFLFKQAGEVVHGVEVTEFYPSEADARLKNYAGYASRVLGGGGYHKGDEALLPLVTIAFQKSKTAIKAMYHGRPSRESCIERLRATLLAKNAKCDAYLDAAPSVDLIIGDPCEYMSLEGVRHILSLLLLDSMREQVTTSGFREIFLATDRPRCLYLPLKANLLSMELVTCERRIKASVSQGAIEEYGPAPFLALILHLGEAGLGEALVWLSPTPCLTEVRVALGSLEVRYRDSGRDFKDVVAPLDRCGEWRSISSLLTDFDEEELSLARSALGPPVESWACVPRLFEGSTGRLVLQPQSGTS